MMNTPRSHQQQTRPSSADASAANSAGRVWLVGVVVAYTSFALGTLAVVAFTFTQKVELVSDKHYQQGVAFQQRIEAANRAAALTEPITWRISITSQNKHALEILYPAELRAQGEMRGTITFLRPSSTEMDKRFAVQVDADGKQRIPLDSFAKGLWSVSLELSAGSKHYFKALDLKL
jgi:nitrogen fixation protein FixH